MSANQQAFHDGITFEMNKVTINSSGEVYVVANTTKYLETSFNTTNGRVGYVKMDGLLAKGKRKNAYTESYADSDRLRVYQDSNGVTREATTITLTLAFEGSAKQTCYESFYAYVKNGIIQYKDTKRNKYAFLILIDAVDPNDDVWKGSVPYIKADFKFQNVYGTTFTSITNHIPTE